MRFPKTGVIEILGKAARTQPTQNSRKDRNFERWNEKNKGRDRF